MHGGLQLCAMTAVTGLAGCAGPLSALDPAGPAAAAIARLWWVMLAGASLLFALVIALFVLSYLRPGWGNVMTPKRWLIVGGLVLPGVVLLPLLVYGLIAGERLLALPGVTPPRIEVHAQQWHWNFRYPEHGGITTIGRLHMPAGTPVDLIVTSEDVIHALWIPRLGGKVDAIPGLTNVLRLQADVPGRYEGLCAEFCGLEHTRMRFEVIVHAPEVYAEALARDDAGAEP